MEPATTWLRKFDMIKVYRHMSTILERQGLDGRSRGVSRAQLRSKAVEGLVKRSRIRRKSRRYNAALVEKVLSAKAAQPVDVPADPEEFLNWLETDE